MNTYYNEIEAFPCQVIRNNIARGRLPQGFVDERDIKQVDPTELIQYTQLHLFAGIAAAAYACRLAGMPDDFSIGTFGFPCQDISVAGKGEGLTGKRSGLFYEAVRIFAVARPTWLLAENVAALRTRGAGTVVQELEGIGYTVLDPIVVGADDIGAPHRRKRVWIVAFMGNAKSNGRDGALRNDEWQAIRETLRTSSSTGRNELAHADRNGCGGHGALGRSMAEEARLSAFDGSHLDLDSRASRANTTYRETRNCEDVADANSERLEGQRNRTIGTCTSQPMPSRHCGWPSRPNEPQHNWEEPRTIKSQVGCALDGDAKRLVRAASRHRKESLKVLGNAWVPQAAVPILRWIVEVDAKLSKKQTGQNEK